MPKPKRVNKTKEQLIAEQKSAEANEKIKIESDRKRSLIREQVFPLLLSMGGDIRYLKIFLYTAQTAINQAIDSRKEKLIVKDVIDEVAALFRSDDPETQKKLEDYNRLFNLLQNESITSFNSMIRDLPDNIDRYFFHQMEKKNVDQINIDEVLG